VAGPNPQAYLDACKDEIDEFTMLRPGLAIEALAELEEYARERRLDVEQRLAVEELRRANRASRANQR